MPPRRYRNMGELLQELDQRAKVLQPLMPYGQTLLFDWQHDVSAEDGTRVGCFANAYTRRKLFVAEDGRVFGRGPGGVFVASADPAATVRAALPTLRDWIWVGGYAAGDMLGPPVHEEDFAF